MRLLSEGGEIYVGVGYNFSDNRANSRGLWIRRHRCCIGWNCKGSILCIPGYLRCLLPARPEGKRGTIIAGCWPVGKVTNQRTDGARKQRCNSVQRYTFFAEPRRIAFVEPSQAASLSSEFGRIGCEGKSMAPIVANCSQFARTQRANHEERERGSSWLVQAGARYLATTTLGTRA